MYICELPNNKQKKIEIELTKALKMQGYKGCELAELVADGMDGKLSDIDDLIRVKRYH